VADKALSALEELISSGGLNPREMKEATQALKATLDARRAEDYPELETSGKQKSEEPYQLFDERGLPKNLGIVFNALDIQTAKEEADEEKAQEAGERLLRACEQEGVDPTEVDWSSLHDWRVPYAGYDSSVGEG
jgi:hypothetical protein